MAGQAVRTAKAVRTAIIFFRAIGNNMCMIKSGTSIYAVKQAIAECADCDVIVKLNLGRNKFTTFKATLSGVYPAIFTVAPHDKNFVGKTAYSYSEILCGRVKITKAQGGAERSG